MKSAYLLNSAYYREAGMNDIDAVISWVDGDDPVFKQKLSTYCQQQGIEPFTAVEPTRIQQCNEIHYCLHALRCFAPWLRRIYIITNQQIPPTVAAMQGTAFGNKIQIIDQNDLLNKYSNTTPIFNSISAEWLIWLIPGLSKQFIYLNDDFFIIRPVEPTDFFRQGRLVLRGEWKVKTTQKWGFRLTKKLFGRVGYVGKQKNNPHRAWQEKTATTAGFTTRFYLLPHAPFPLLQETFAHYMADKTDLFLKNIQFAFRHPDQLSSVPLMVHVDVQQDRVVYDSSLQAVMVNGDCHSFKKIKSRLHDAHKNARIAFVCMQSLDQAPEKVRHYMINWLQEHIAE